MSSEIDRIRSNNNVVYRCSYHVVWCPKYRRDTIQCAVDKRLKEVIEEVYTEKLATVIALECQTTFTFSYQLIRNTESTDSSKESRAARSGCYAKSSHTLNRRC